MAGDVKIHIEGTAYDLEDFELGELEWLEEYIDAPLTDSAALNRMKTAVAFVYLIKKREDPSYTLEQARKIKLAAIDAPDEEPEEQPARRPTKGARSSKSA